MARSATKEYDAGLTTRRTSWRKRDELEEDEPDEREEKARRHGRRARRHPAFAARGPAPTTTYRATAQTASRGKAKGSETEPNGRGAQARRTRTRTRRTSPPRSGAEVVRGLTASAVRAPAPFRRRGTAGDGRLCRHRWCRCPRSPADPSSKLLPPVDATVAVGVDLESDDLLRLRGSRVRSVRPSPSSSCSMRTGRPWPSRVVQTSAWPFVLVPASDLEERALLVVVLPAVDPAVRVFVDLDEARVLLPVVASDLFCSAVLVACRARCGRAGRASRSRPCTRHDRGRRRSGRCERP